MITSGIITRFRIKYFKIEHHLKKKYTTKDKMERINKEFKKREQDDRVLPNQGISIETRQSRYSSMENEDGITENKYIIMN